MILVELQLIDVLVHLLYFTIPALIVFGITYFLMQKMTTEQQKLRILELKKQQNSQITPIKLQAYERLTLYLDRISPENLVLRLSKRGQSANQLRQELTQTVQSEYNHNISQQIYVSDESWKMITAVKEQILNTVENCYAECDETESGPELGKKILSTLMTEKTTLTQRAIQLLKKEIEIAL
jgi:DNA anti-recombination protein RmuC